MSRSTARVRLTAVATALAATAAFGAAAPADAQGTAEHGTAEQGAARQKDKKAKQERVVRYVALGDSYTSSPLTGPLAGAPAGCLRSTNNYPHLVAADLGAKLTDVSCSGATSEDFSSSQVTDAGTNPPQYDALSDRADLVSVGIGGNDIGFSSIIGRCARLTVQATPSPGATPCKDEYAPQGGTDQLRARIDAVAPDIATVLDTVRSRTRGNTEVLLVGYPAILPETYIATCVASVPFYPGDIDYLRGVEKYLNSMLEGQARAESLTSYVDTYTPSIGHDACQVPEVRWVEGLEPQRNAYPVHPNADGQVSSAGAVLSTLGR